MYSQSAPQLRFQNHRFARAIVKPCLWVFIMLLSFCFSGIAQAEKTELLKKKYHGFTLWLDCHTHHGAVAFHYKIGKDKANVRKKNINFDFDRKVSISCQPQTWRSYRTTTVDPLQGQWRRGTLVPSNHMDGNLKSFKETYSLTNTLPQNAILSRAVGTWYLTEMITECYRDISPLDVWGGVIWGEDTENDFFTVTHGIKTPDFWWKLIYRHDKKTYLAWIFPNHWSAKASKMDTFLVSIKKLESMLEFMPDIGTLLTSPQASITPKNTWPVEISDKTLKCEGKTTSSD